MLPIHPQTPRGPLRVRVLLVTPVLVALLYQRAPPPPFRRPHDHQLRIRRRHYVTLQLRPPTLDRPRQPVARRPTSENVHRAATLATSAEPTTSPRASRRQRRLPSSAPAAAARPRAPRPCTGPLPCACSRVRSVGAPVEERRWGRRRGSKRRWSVHAAALAAAACSADPPSKVSLRHGRVPRATEGRATRSLRCELLFSLMDLGLPEGGIRGKAPITPL